VKQLLVSAMINSIWAIWIARNTSHFQWKSTTISSMINTVIIEVKLGFELALAAGSSSMTEFRISQLFGIPIKPRRIATCPEIHWEPPSFVCVKLNTDGSSVGSPPSGAIGVVFRNNLAHFLGGFVQNIRYATALEAEFSAVMYAIEKAAEMRWNNIWIETDSLVVIKAFKSDLLVPWRMQNRWYNCKKLISHSRCKCSHIRREGNRVADAMARNGQGLAMHSSQWWSEPPLIDPSFPNNQRFLDTQTEYANRISHSLSKGDIAADIEHEVRLAYPESGDNLYEFSKLNSSPLVELFRLCRHAHITMIPRPQCVNSIS